MQKVSLTLYDLSPDEAKKILDMAGGGTQAAAKPESGASSVAGHDDLVAETPSRGAESPAVFTEGELQKKSREQLVAIGDKLGLRTKGKRVNTLVGMILEAQGANGDDDSGGEADDDTDDDFIPLDDEADEWDEDVPEPEPEPEPEDAPKKKKSKKGKKLS